MNRKETLEAAAAVVTGERETTYGGPEDSFARIAQLWDTYIQAKYFLDEKVFALAPIDVALMMDLMKTARLMESPYHVDSWIDKAGYAACGAEIATEGAGV